jgi:hypothetical protein
MNAKKLSNGNLLIPKRVEGKGGAVGDAMVEVKPGTPEYDEWLPFVEGGKGKTAKLSTGAEARRRNRERKLNDGC